MVLEIKTQMFGSKMGGVQRTFWYKMIVLGWISIPRFEAHPCPRTSSYAFPCYFRVVWTFLCWCLTTFEPFWTFRNIFPWQFIDRLANCGEPQNLRTYNLEEVQKIENTNTETFNHLRNNIPVETGRNSFAGTNGSQIEESRSIQKLSFCIKISFDPPPLEHTLWGANNDLRGPQYGGGGGLDVPVHMVENLVKRITWSLARKFLDF